MDFLLCLMAAFLGFPLTEAESPSLRLEGWLDPCAGRVEIYHQQEWGTVCDDDWNMLAALVVCRQLNCGTAVRVPQGAFFGHGSGRIWLDNVKCKGTETSLQQCAHPAWGRHNCRHEEDAGVVCSAATTLLDGVFPSPAPLDKEKTEPSISTSKVGVSDKGKRKDLVSKAVQHKSGGQDKDSQGGSRHRQSQHQKISGATTFEEAASLPSEHLDKQESDEFILMQTSISSKDQGSVRLVGGTDHCSGRVEIFHGTEWGTVCDDNWDSRDAAVVCKQLGCGPAVAAYSRAKFGLGLGKIWLDEVQCTGVESSLGECIKMPWGESNCMHDEDASVVCAEAKGVTLVNGPGRCAGRVEVYYENTWGTICDDLWGLTNAHVVCQQLGCGSALSAPGTAFFGEGKGPIWLDNVNCTGRESSVLDCPSEPWGKHNCRHREDAGVVCSDELLAAHPIERYNESTVSKQGNTTTTTTISAHPETEITPPVPERKPSVDSPTGQETEQWFIALPPPIVVELLEESPAPPMRPHEKSTSEPSVQQPTSIMAGKETDSTEAQPVEESSSIPLLPSIPTHRPPETSGIRLAGGPNRCSGRVEVYHDQQWGTVCDDGWGNLEAQVVCRQLGCGPLLHFHKFYGPGSGPIWKDEVSCYGIESSLTQCLSNAWGYTDCDHSEDTGVQCREATSMDEIFENVTVLPPTKSDMDLYKVTMEEASPGPEKASRGPEECPKPEMFNNSCPHVDCVCRTPMAACQPQLLPELVKILGEMKGDFSSITHLLQDDKHQLQSMASSMREVASSLHQLLEMFTVHFSKRSPGVA